MSANARPDTALTAESKVTVRCQTTIPAPVREALKLQPGKDHIQYELLSFGKVQPGRQETAQEDEVRNAFLHFFAADIKSAPRNVKPFDMSRGREGVQA